jgi:hypothetical protein
LCQARWLPRPKLRWSHSGRIHSAESHLRARFSPCPRIENRWHRTRSGASQLPLAIAQICSVCAAFSTPPDLRWNSAFCTIASQSGRVLRLCRSGAHDTRGLAICRLHADRIAPARTFYARVQFDQDRPNVARLGSRPKQGSFDSMSWSTVSEAKVHGCEFVLVQR